MEESKIMEEGLPWGGGELLTLRDDLAKDDNADGGANHGDEP